MQSLKKPFLLQFCFQQMDTPVCKLTFFPDDAQSQHEASLLAQRQELTAGHRAQCEGATVVYEGTTACSQDTLDSSGSADD